MKQNQFNSINSLTIFNSINHIFEMFIRSGQVVFYKFDVIYMIKKCFHSFYILIGTDKVIIIIESLWGFFIIFCSLKRLAGSFT